MSYEEEIGIQGVLPGREESPTMERTTRLQIEAAFRLLVETKTLYQNVEIDVQPVEKELESIGELIKKHYETERFKGGVTQKQIDKIRIESAEMWAKRKAAVLAEVPHRPWRLKTLHISDDQKEQSVIVMASQGLSQPLETPLLDREICFIAPSAQLYCGKCKREASFEALHASSTRPGLGNPFPRLSGGKREQLYLIYYRCVMCRDQIHGVLVRRRGCKLTLCGFAPRKQQQATRKLKKNLVAILENANDAVAEGDLYAGFYHARTLLEHYLRDRQGLQPSERIRGEQLIDNHYANLSPKFKDALPSLQSVFADLSDRLHARSGSKHEFDSLIDKLCGHIEMVEQFEKFQN